MKRVLKRALTSAYTTVSRLVPTPDQLLYEQSRLGYYHRVDQGTQILLRLQYQEMLRNRVPLPSSTLR